VKEERKVERALEAAARGEPRRSRLWPSFAAQRRRLEVSARRLLKRSSAEVQALALRGVPDLRLDWLRRVSHAALLAQGAESWTGMLGGHRVHRYAFAGRGKDRPVLLLHGLGGSADSMATLVAPLLPISSRVVLLELPGHGRSPQPPQGPLPAREYGQVVTAAVDRLHADYGKVALVGNSLGGALALYAAHVQADKVAGVVGLNPAGAELSEEALGVLPDSFADERAGAARMAELLFHRTPLPFWLVARDFARGWSSPTVQRILDDARHDRDRSLGIQALSAIRAPVLILWGAQDRLLPSTSADDFRRNIPGAIVELIPECGHIPQLERPAFTRRRVREFIEKLKV
jgi:pimeloyl-ACP methyl ester carboxylesterase